MIKAFLTPDTQNSSITTAVISESTPEPGREKIRILVIGSSPGVDRIIHEFYRIGFAEIREWSDPQSTGRNNEVMRILTRWILTP